MRLNIVTDTCPPLEDIAAFLDGRLPEEERARIVAHLADCESCYAVFADAARFQLEEEKEEEESRKRKVAANVEPVTEKPAPAPVIPFHRRPAVRWALPLAALLVLGVATIPLYQRYNTMPTLLATELVDPAALKSVSTESLWKDDKRGHPTAVIIDSTPFEFLLGVHMVGLRLTLARNESAESLNMLSRIIGHMEQLISVDTASEFYLRAHGEINQGMPPKELVEEAAEIEASLTAEYQEQEIPHLAFGKWTEAGRLSALARNPAFFADRANRRFPGWLLRRAQEDLANDEEVVRNLRRIRGILDDSDPAKLPYDDIEKRLESILEYYQREADAAAAAP